MTKETKAEKKPIVNPLAPKSAEKKAEIALQLAGIRKSHGKVMQAVRNKYMGDPKPIFVDNAR